MILKLFVPSHGRIFERVVSHRTGWDCSIFKGEKARLHLLQNFFGVQAKYNEVQVKYNGVQMKYSEVQPEYGRSTVKYERSTVEYSGVQAKYKWSTSGVRTPEVSPFPP
jgi:hypothetical protein